MPYEILPMTLDDYSDVLSLWQTSEGIGLSSADSRDGIARFLERNPGLAFVARDPAGLAGAVMVGEDGRRGYLYHLAVSPRCRRQGIGQALVERCLEGLRRCGIEKCHIFVYHANAAGKAFWEQAGFAARPDLVIMSHSIS
jgi:ribosomal protein S18 acetylase RimI-like enzyme